VAIVFERVRAEKKTASTTSPGRAAVAPVVDMLAQKSRVSCNAE